jgi:hypothetical protein
LDVSLSIVCVVKTGSSVALRSAALRPPLVIEEAVELGDVGHEANLLDAGRLLARNSQLRVVALAKVTGVLEKLQFCVRPLARWQTAVAPPGTGQQDLDIYQKDEYTQKKRKRERERER